VKQLQIDLDEERELVSELEGLLIQRETDLDSVQSRLSQQDAHCKHQLQQAQEQLRQLETAYAQVKRESETKAQQVSQREQVESLQAQL
jgi:multidrug resistance efflux pump